MTKATSFGIPSMAAKFSNTVQSPYCLNTFRSMSYFEHASKFTGCVDGNDFFLRDLMDFIDNIKAMIMTGNEGNAEVLIRAKYEGVKEKVNAGVKGSKEALDIASVGMAYAVLGNLELVKSIVGVLMEVVVDLKDEDMQVMGHILVLLGLLYSALGKFDKAMLVYQKAISIVEDQHGKSSSALVNTYVSIGDSLSSYGKATKAIEFYQHAITILESRSRCAETEELINFLAKRCRLLIKEGKAKDAETHSLRSKSHFEYARKFTGGISSWGRELKEFVNKVEAMIRAGNIDEAEGLLGAKYEDMKEKVNGGSKDIKDACIIDVIGIFYAVYFENLEAVDSVVGMLTEIVSGLKDDAMHLDQILVHMGYMYSALGKFEKSVLVCQRAISILEDKYGKNNVALELAYLIMGSSLSSMGKATKAIEFYRQAITILESSRGAESEELIVPLDELSSLLIIEGKTKEAETHSLRLLNISTKLSGEYSERVGTAVLKLAIVKKKMGDLEEAIRLFRNAYQIFKDSNYMAVEDSTMERIRMELGCLLHEVGRERESQEVIEESLLIAEKSRGIDHPSLAEKLSYMGISHLNAKNYEEAEPFLRKCLQLKTKTAGPDDPEIASMMLNLATALTYSQRADEAEKLAMQALQIREKAFGEDSLLVADAIDHLWAARALLGKGDEEQLTNVKRAMKIREKEGTSKQLLETLGRMEVHLFRLGRKEELLSIQKRISVLRMKPN